MGEAGDDIKYAAVVGGSYLFVNHAVKPRKSRFGVRFGLLCLFSSIFVV